MCDISELNIKRELNDFDFDVGGIVVLFLVRFA